MEEAVYKVIEIVGSSKTSVEDAVQNAINKTGKTVRNIRWFEVAGTRGYIEDGRIAYWQVHVKIGFHVDQQMQEENRKETGSENKSNLDEPVKYRCLVCGYVYDPSKGDPTAGIKEGTSFEDLPDDWRCPECGVGKDQFERM